MAAYFRLLRAASYTVRGTSKLYTFSGSNVLTVEDPTDIATLRGKQDMIEECDSKGRPLISSTPAQSKTITSKALSYAKLPKPEAKPAPAPVPEKAVAPKPAPAPAPAPEKAPEPKVDADAKGDEQSGKKDRGKK